MALIRGSVLLLLGVALPLSAVAAQTHDEANVTFGITAGYIGGTDLWSVKNQSYYDEFGRVHHLDFNRKFASSATFGLQGAVYTSPHLGFTGEFSYIGLPADDHCTTTEATTKGLCELFTWKQAASATALAGGVVWRPSSRTALQPFARALVGVVLLARSTTRVASKPDELTGTQGELYQDPGHGSSRPQATGAIGIATAPDGGFQLSLEARATITSFSVVTGTNLQTGAGAPDRHTDEDPAEHHPRFACGTEPVARPTLLMAQPLAPLPTLSVADATRTILSHIVRQPALRVPLLDAIGHILAEDVHAPISLPPWTNAGMDGYAVRAEDIRGATTDAPVVLRVIEAIAAGGEASREVQQGEAARIFTGAPVPAGADSVVRQEDTDRGSNTVQVRDARDAGHNVRRAGADLVAGDLALERGTVIGPHQLALLASLGVTTPMVHRKPRIGVLGTGDELASLDHPEEILSGRKLGNVNGPAIEALVRETGGVAVSLGIVGDDPAAIRQRLADATDVDLLITAGGVSVGDHDHVRAVVTSLGGTMQFTRVAVRPGGPTSCAVLPDGRLWIGLPGNPVSAMVTYELFARPAIRAMLGDPAPERTRIRVVVEEEIRREPRLTMWLRATFVWPEEGGIAHARLTGAQGSGMLSSVARAHGLIEIPPGEGSLPSGSTVTALSW